jgi:hypothetical protein
VARAVPSVVKSDIFLRLSVRPGTVDTKMKGCDLCL